MTEQSKDTLDEVCECNELPKIKLINAPESLEDAIERIVKLETALDDLARASEIAQYSKQYDRANLYIREAEELLQDRILFPEEEQGDFKFTMIEGSMSEETKQAVTDMAEKAKKNA